MRLKTSRLRVRLDTPLCVGDDDRDRALLDRVGELEERFFRLLPFSDLLLEHERLFVEHRLRLFAFRYIDNDPVIAEQGPN